MKVAVQNEVVDSEQAKLKKVGIINLGFDAYLDDIPDEITNLKFNETARATIVMYPKSFNEIVYTLSHNYSLDGFIMEECLIRYGLSRLFYDEIASFGLEKKVDVFKRMKRHIQIPSSEANKLEIYRENCSVCRKKVSLSEKSMSLVMHVGSLFDMGTSDVLMLCILISLNESAFVNKGFYWFKKDFGLEREKKGFKIIKEKSMILRSKLKIYKKKIDDLYLKYQFKISSGEITEEEKEELKDIIKLKSDMYLLKLDSDHRKKN